MFKSLNVTLELKSVFQQGQLRHVSRRPDGFNLGDDRSQLVALHRRIEGRGKFVERGNSLRPWDSSSAGNTFQIAARGSGCRKSSDGKQALIIKDHMNQVLGPIARQRGRSQ